MTDPCYVCNEIDERSDTYERWLFAENFGDSATLEAAAIARGYCTLHARRIVEGDPNVAGPIAAFVLRSVDAELHRQISDRHGYRDALDARARCPWCQTELDALEYALMRNRPASGTLCQPHAQARSELRANQFRARSPLIPGDCLSCPSETMRPELDSAWWSPTIADLARRLQSGACPACLAADEASDRRFAFYRAGSRDNEHWETPRLCRLHDAALGQPRTRDFVRDPDGIDRLCDWCRVMERAAHRAADLFAGAYPEPAFRLRYANNPGLCLPHAAVAMHSLDGDRDTRNWLAGACKVRVATMIWELEERASRRSWHLRDQGEPGHANTLSQRAWWLLTGGSHRFNAE